jgi:hypothetical protein
LILNLPTYNQGTTVRITATLTDEEGEAVPTSSLTTLTATLYDRLTGDVINSRDGQNIKNANGGTYADGALALVLAPLDSPHNGGATVEEHVLLLEWTYNGGAQGGSEELLLRVRDVGMVA